MNKLILGFLLTGAAGVSFSCGETTNFSMASESSIFKQNSMSTNGKVDVLFVIDNSGTMASSQANVAANFQKFIQLFNQRGIDYRLAVTTTEAYRDDFVTPQSFAQYRDGTDKTSHTGVRLISPQTPNLEQTFLTNIIQGTAGSGDERAFQSFHAALSSPLNSNFPRPDAFLSIIIVSDEDDFSVDTPLSTYTHDYGYLGLHTIDRYVSYLDTITGADSTTRSSKYNVNAIAVTDQACLDQRNAQAPNEYLIAQRYMDIAGRTNGIIGSLCGDFGMSLSNISNKIVELTTQFYLGRPAVPSTLSVYVAGERVPQLQPTDPQPWNGFLYKADSKSLSFFGRYVPQPAAIISVDFVPAAIK
jgi:hypothetical protein